MAGPERWALAPSANLNSILREVVQHLFDEGPHANFFRNAVSCVVVDDYRDHVPAEREMYLSKMLQRTEAQHYTDVAAFRADLQLMYENAAAYNSRNSGKHAYEPVIHWASDLLAVADKELQRRAQTLRETAALQRPPCHLQTGKADEAMAEVATDSAAPAAPAADPPSGGPSPPSTSAPAKPCDDTSQQPPAVMPPLPQQDPQQPGPQPQDDYSKHLSPVEQLQQLQQQQQLPGPAAAGAQGSPRAANGSAGQQSSSPSSGSAGSGAPSGLEALLAACELAAEQDSAAPRSDGAAAANAAAPERRSYPGCAASGGDTAPDAGAGQGPLSAPRQQLLPGGQQQHHHDDPAGSSEGAGMALCCVRSGGSSGDGVASTAQPQPGAGGGGGGGSGGGGAAGAGGSYLASNAFKNRRHKSKVYIKPNKVVYLPTTFVEEEFDVTALPLECELRVEADGVQTDDTFRVTIKSVPRQGLSTMYCMTNVMRFQQQYLNWQIYNWTRIDNNHIKIHLQSPSPSQTQLQLQRPDLDRSASMPEVGRSLVCMRGSEDGAAAAGGQPRGNGIGGATSSSLKRKSDTGRYNNFPRVERRLVPEPGRDLPVDLRLSSTGYLQYPSPIPESPPASPQRRISACLAGGPTAAGGSTGAHAAALPPRAPQPGRLPLPQGAHPHHPHHNAHHHLQQQQPQQVHFHIHQHPPGVAGPYHHLSQHQQRMQQQLYQPHPHLHSNGGSGGGGGHPPLSLPFSLQPSHQQHQHQRGSNSSIKTEQGGTCSEDSSGPVAAGSGAADAASMPPLPLTWHPHPAGAAAGGARLQAARLSGSAAGPAARGAAPPPPAAALHPLELSQQLQELAEQLQLRAQAAGGELSGLTALQLAMAALQQQQLQAAAAAPPPPPPAPLDLCSPADQERLLQHLGLSLGGAGGLSLHPYLPQHARGPRGSGSNMLDLEMADVHPAAAAARRSGSGDGMAGTAAAQDSGFPQRGPISGNSGAIEPYGQQQSQLQLAQLHPGPGSLHSEQQKPQQGQQRRPSHGDRCRQQQGGGAACAGAGLDGERPESADAAAKDAATAVEMEEAQHGGAVAVEEEEMEEPHHIVCHPRRSGNGGGGNASGYGAGKLYIAGGPVAAGGGRILLEVGQLGGGRVSGNGRGRGDLAPGQGVGGMGGGGGLAAFQPGGLDLADCGAADIYSYLSPSKRFKVAVSADNAAAAAAAMAVGGGELSFLDVLSLRAAAGGLPAEAALAAALRQGGGGAGAFPPAAAMAAAAALGGRHFLPVGSKIMGQMM